MRDEHTFTLMGLASDRDGPLGSPPFLEYTEEERRLSVRVQRELNELLGGVMDHLVLLKLYARRDDESGFAVAPQAQVGAVRREVVQRLATDAITFFGPLHGGITAQEVVDEVVIQRQGFSTAYPHIRLDRYDVYDPETKEPLLGAWRASRIQNQRRETRTNRLIDIALLALEVSKSVFPDFLG